MERTFGRVPIFYRQAEGEMLFISGLPVYLPTPNPILPRLKLMVLDDVITVVNLD